MDKELKDMTFNEVAREALQYDLDAIVQGKALASRIKSIGMLFVEWERGRQADIHKSA